MFMIVVNLKSMCSSSFLRATTVQLRWYSGNFRRDLERIRVHLVMAVMFLVKG